MERNGDGESVNVKYDTHIMDRISLPKMAKLPAAFEPGGVITANQGPAKIQRGGYGRISLSF